MGKMRLFGIMVCWSVAVSAQTGSSEQTRSLVAQKIKLVEMLLASPSAKASAAADSDTQPLVERGRKAIELARAALADGRLEEAQQVLDETLKTSSAQSRRLQAESGLAQEVQRQSYQNLMEQVATYRAAVSDLLRDPKAGPNARALLARIDAQIADARKQEAAGHLADANRILSDAYKLAVSEISRLRAGQEVVMSLNFENPADEYAYEQRRFESGEIMVSMMMAEGRAGGEQRVMVDGFASEGKRLKAEAAHLAEGGRHKEAVGVMEKATGQINRALQAMGVPVF